MYNPFIPFTTAILQQIIAEGNRYWVVQRFNWPGIPTGKGFLVSAYPDIAEAEEHQSQLLPNEGKQLNASDDLDKILELLKPEAGYRFFLNRFKENNWNKSMLRMYQDRIVSYLKGRTNFKREDSIDILFTLVAGRVMARITAVDKKMEVDAYELIK